MVKGISRQVIVVHSPDPKLFEQAIFILKDGAVGKPRRYVVGLREGCMLHLEDGKLSLIGSRPMRIFKKGCAPREVVAGDDLSFLL